MAKTIVISGSGTGASAADTNGGMYEGAVTWTTFQDANGAPLDTAAAATATNNGSGVVRLTSAGNFANSLVDVYCYCDFAATYTDGHYLITAVDAGGDYVDLDLVYSADTTADVNVGGALETIDYPRTAGLYAIADKLKVSNAVTYSTANANNAILQTDFTVTGANAYALTQNAIHCMGVDATTGEIDYTNPAELDATLTAIGIITVSRHIYENFYLHDGSGVGVSGAGGFDNFTVRHCEIDSFGSHGIEGDDSNHAKFNYVHDNGGRGILFDNTAYIVGNWVQDNASNGIEFDGGFYCGQNICIDNLGTYQINGNYGVFDRNIMQAAAGTLMYFDEQNQQPFIITNNIFDGVDKANAVVGLQAWSVVDPPDYVTITNNVFHKCGEGITLGSTMNGNEFVDGNCFFDCTTKYNAILTNSTNEITTDPGFNDTTTYDYRVGNGANAENAGVDFNFTKDGITSNHNIGAYTGALTTVSSSGSARNIGCIGIIRG